MLFQSFGNDKSREKNSTKCIKNVIFDGNEDTVMEHDQRHCYTVPFHRDRPFTNHTKVSLRSHSTRNVHRNRGALKKMASKVSNFSDLIQRVTASCLLHPLAPRPYDPEDDEDEDRDERERDEGYIANDILKTEDEDENTQQPRIVELEMIMGQVFDAVSVMKRAYITLQESHSPWDPDKMRVADMAVVAELRRLGLLRERFRRSVVAAGSEGGSRWRLGSEAVREIVAPYEAAVEELKREVKVKQAEVENLKENLKTIASIERNGSGKNRGKSKRRVGCTTQVASAPAVELFESTMNLVKEASKSFTSLLLSLMRLAHWDISAAVKSIEAAASTTMGAPSATTTIATANHAKYALESYVNRKIFQGFDHETFYMDGSLSSILHPDQHRQDCFTQYRDMKAMDPTELLSILPTCSFGNFCFKKYLSIVHPKMEESLFGNLDQRRQVLDGHHPRSQFYGEFLGLAKAVWLLHLLAFSLDPTPSHFEASKGAEFHSQYMESVVKISNGNGGSRVAMAMVVGFPVSPGFKLGNGSIIKARVYLVPKN